MSSREQSPAPDFDQLQKVWYDQWLYDPVKERQYHRTLYQQKPNYRDALRQFARAYDEVELLMYYLNEIDANESIQHVHLPTPAELDNMKQEFEQHPDKRDELFIFLQTCPNFQAGVPELKHHFIMFPFREAGEKYATQNDAERLRVREYWVGYLRKCHEYSPMVGVVGGLLEALYKLEAQRVEDQYQQEWDAEFENDPSKRTEIRIRYAQSLGTGQKGNEAAARLDAIETAWIERNKPAWKKDFADDQNKRWELWKLFFLYLPQYLDEDLQDVVDYFENIEAPWDCLLRTYSDNRRDAAFRKELFETLRQLVRMNEQTFSFEMLDDLMEIEDREAQRNSEPDVKEYLDSQTSHADRRALYAVYKNKQELFPHEPDCKKAMDVFEKYNLRNAELKPFSKRTAHEQQKVQQILQDIAIHWDLLAAIEAFDSNPELLIPSTVVENSFFPELDASDMRNWHINLLEALEELAEISAGQCEEAMLCITESIARREMEEIDHLVSTERESEAEKWKVWMKEVDVDHAIEEFKRRHPESGEGRAGARKRTSPERSPLRSDPGDDDDEDSDDDNNDGKGGSRVDKGKGRAVKGGVKPGGPSRRPLQLAKKTRTPRFIPVSSGSSQRTSTANSPRTRNPTPRRVGRRSFPSSDDPNYDLYCDPPSIPAPSRPWWRSGGNDLARPATMSSSHRSRESTRPRSNTQSSPARRPRSRPASDSIPTNRQARSSSSTRKRKTRSYEDQTFKPNPPSNKRPRSQISIVTRSSDALSSAHSIPTPTPTPSASKRRRSSTPLSSARTIPTPTPTPSASPFPRRSARLKPQPQTSASSRDSWWTHSSSSHNDRSDDEDYVPSE